MGPETIATLLGVVYVIVLLVVMFVMSKRQEKRDMQANNQHTKELKERFTE